MATDYNGNSTRVHWTGAASATDQHLEMYTAIVDTKFKYESMFKNLVKQRRTNGDTNTYRTDRMGTGVIKGRKSGDSLDSTRIVNEKVTFIVDTVLYARNPIDYQDDWTSPDWLADIAANNASEFARVYDSAFLSQIVKARAWVNPPSLGTAFSPGIEQPCAIKSGNTTEADDRASAVAIGNAHKAIVNKLIKRDIPLNDMITMADPDIFSLLLEHPKLFNRDFNASPTGDYAGRRITMLNGIQIVEATCFPSAIVANHPLGTAYNWDANDILCKMVIFSKSKMLMALEAMPMTVRVYDDKPQFANVLDAYTMYSVGILRGDVGGSVKFTITPVV